nr:hypothetical protein [Pandoravirus massiliensis]
MHGSATRTGGAQTHAHGRKRKRSPLGAFEAALAALAGPGRSDRPYADDADRRMGSIQRADSVAGRLARMRRARCAPIDGALPLPAASLPSLSPLADMSARSAVDMLFRWLESVVISDSVAWDAIDLEAAPDDVAVTALVIAEWMDDCFCAKPSERRRITVGPAPNATFDNAYDRADDKDEDEDDEDEDDDDNRRRAVDWSRFGGDDGVLDDGDSDDGLVLDDLETDDIVTAFWIMEQLEVGARGDGAVRTRSGLVDVHGDAICLRLAAASAVKHVAPDYEDVAEVFYDLRLGRAVGRIGRMYRSALCACLARLYVVYRDLANAVDATPCAQCLAPPGCVPTPRSVRAWVAAHPIEAEPFAMGWTATCDNHPAMGDADGDQNAPLTWSRFKRRRRQHVPRGGLLPTPSDSGSPSKDAQESVSPSSPAQSPLHARDKNTEKNASPKEE